MNDLDELLAFYGYLAGRVHLRTTDPIEVHLRLGVQSPAQKSVSA